MKFVVAVIFLFAAFRSLSQPYSATGNVVGQGSRPVASAVVTVQRTDSSGHAVTTNRDGAFLIAGLHPGCYRISVHAAGYEPYADSFRITDANYSLGTLAMLPAIHMLDEVKVVEKVLAMVQKDDTLEFSSGAYSVNPDADGTDLVRKMPTIEINDKTITAQGENVLKILVDGKPFFGNDPWAALKNLPADMIDKVQVYNEKSDQEQFTGFSEGPTSKTINIITNPARRNGSFGKIYAGGGGDPNTIAAPQADARYGTGLTLNEFAGDRRFTLTGQANNINAQNFTDNNTGADAAAGTATTQAAGLNYTDKWGARADVSGSYFFNRSENSVSRQMRKTYLSSVDSGDVYTENSPTSGSNYSHRLNLRLNYKFDSLNSLLFVPGLSVNSNGSNSRQDGNTDSVGNPVNRTFNLTGNNNASYTLSNNLLFRHRFRKKGRTLSVSITTTTSNNRGDNHRTDTTTYFGGAAAGDTINQHGTQQVVNTSASGNMTYTEPVGEKGMMKAEYTAAYTPSRSDKYTYDYDTVSGAYTLPDARYSNTYSTASLAHTAGASYLFHLRLADVSIGANYQLTHLTGTQELPLPASLSQHFQAVLPVATFHYKISKSRNLQITYNTSTQTPSISQLQAVINNTDPLHLTTGNAHLRQPYRNNLSVRYNAMSKTAKNNLSASLTGGYSLHNIGSSSLIAAADTVLAQGIVLHRGSQLTMPVNIDGGRSLTGNMSYGLPLGFIKSRLNLSLNLGIAQVPSMINNQVNSQENRNGGLGITMSSNISQYVDFVLSSTTSMSQSINSVSAQSGSRYASENARASVNLQSHSGIVFNTTLSYQGNAGLSSGYNQDYLLCNMSVGKKIFAKHRGDIRISVFDLFNQNSSIQHTVTDIYIADTRSNILQRYFLLVFSWKISSFGENHTEGAGQ